MKGLLISLAAVAVASASFAGITGSGAVSVIPSPVSVKQNDLTSQTKLFSFAEQQNVTLKHKLRLDITTPGLVDSNSDLTPAWLAAGTKVDSYYFHSDTVEGTHVYEGTAVFDEAILGVIVTDGHLNDSDPVLGLAGTAYHTGHSARGLELSKDEDYLNLVDAHTIRWHFRTHNVMDEARVVTARVVPEPGTWAAFGTGIVGLLARRKRRS